MPDPSTTFEIQPHTTWRATGGWPDSTSLAQFWPALAIYAGWIALAWLATVAGTASIGTRAAAIVLLGIGATNALFLMIARSDPLHRPPADTIVLAQCVVAIAWATLFASMSSGAGELIIGIYASIVLFALLRVSRSAFHQITVFAVISYTAVYLIEILSADTQSFTPAHLVEILVFTAIMLCLSIAGRQVYRQHHALEAKLARMQHEVQAQPPEPGVHAANRRYILELLAREKGRTDRSNVPFCICVFNADQDPVSALTHHDQVKTHVLKIVEATMRNELRDMDSLNATGGDERFGTYSDQEYIAILPQTNLRGAQNSAERVLAAVNEQRGSSDNHVTLCGGIAEYQRRESISALLARAENALKQAQTSGTSRVVGATGFSSRNTTRYADVVRLKTRR